MASFSIDFKPSVEKDLRHLPRDIVLRAMEKIEDLKSDPFPSQSIRISGSERLYRVRVGDYRIIYEVDPKAKEITIHYIRPRSTAYLNL
jgi:mRNA interferase RelE/StbE